jgi:hypothetical protein
MTTVKKGVVESLPFFLVTQRKMSCLFQSLGQLTGLDPKKLRHAICNFILQNTELMEGVDTAKVVEWESQQSLDDYVRIMRSTSTWGGATEIAAFVNLYNVPVTVVDLRTHKNIEFKPNRRSRKKALTITWNGSHYQPKQENA